MIRLFHRSPIDTKAREAKTATGVISFLIGSGSRRRTSQ